MNKNFGAGLLFLVLLVSGIAQATTTWSAQDYDLYSGDFNGDGIPDLLYIAKAPGNLSGIALGVSGGFDASFQSWPSNYLGLSWSGNQYNVIILQNTSSANKQADILLQSKSAGGTSYLLQPNSQGRIVGISQPLGTTGGLSWSADQHHIVAGDFNHDGLMDVFLQATSPTGTNSVILAASNAQLSTALAQTPWSDGFLGFNWSTSEAIIYAGDFNGDGYCDLLIQARPRWVMINYDVPFPVPTYPPNLNGVAFSHSSGNLFSASAAPGETLGYYSWSRNAFGVDWSPLVTNILVGNFNGTSYSDVLLQALHSSQSSYLVTANGSTSVFANGTTLASNVSWSADTVHLVAGNYGGGTRTGVYLQSLTPSGTNSFTTNVAVSSVSTTTQDPTAPPPGATPTSAGRTPGTFSVSQSGAADYNIPIWTPPGVGPTQLSLSLNYDSRSPDWVLGVGWSIGGMSAISRCNRTWAQDGYVAGITLTTTDRLCLDGAQLKVVNGSSSAPAQGGTTYATEIESFSTIVAAGSSGSAPTSFTVTTKNGLIYDYGITADSKVLTASGAVRIWALSQIRDRVGNAIKFIYNNDSNPAYGSSSYRIKEVDYPYTANGQGPFYSVNFNYGSRPTGANSPSGYVAGSLVQESNQLNSISIQDYGSSTPIKVYNITYDTSSVTSRLRLRQVQECSASNCLPATQVAYNPGLQGWSGLITTNITAPGPNVQTNQGYPPTTLGDFNGDGLTDVFYASTDSSGADRWYVSFASVGGGYQTPISFGPGAGFLLGHFSGGGQTEIIAPPLGTNGATTLYAYNGSSFVSTNVSVNTTSATGGYYGHFVVADWDGDGLDDIVMSDGVTVAVLRNTTTPGGAVTFASAPQVVYTVPSGTSITLKYSQSYTADFNGDGRADFAITGGDATNLHKVVVLISNGFGSAASVTEIAGVVAPILGDLNGDGCTDIFGGGTIFVSECNGQFASIPTGLSDVADVMVADWDGDGLDDLLYITVGQTQWYVLRSTGNGLVGTSSAIPTGIAPAAVGFPSSYPFYVLNAAGDQNGDSLQDLIFFSPSTLNGPAVLSYAIHAGTGVPEDLATSFTDGFGMYQTANYVSIAQSNYTKCSGSVADCPLATFPEKDTSGPLIVVNQTSASDGAGSVYQDNFWYYGARVQAQGRGFEGFYARRLNDSRNLDSNDVRLYKYDYLNQAFPYTGMPVQQLTSTSGSVSLQNPSAIVDFWTAAGNMSNQTYQGSGQPSSEIRTFPYVHNATESRYEFGALSNSLITTTTKQFTYGDGYGNLTNTQTTVTDNDSTSPFYNSTWQTTVASTFLNDTAAQCLGLPTLQTVTSSAQGQSSQTRTTSFTPDSNHTLCREAQESVEPNTPALNVLKGIQYDSCGNVSEIDITGHNPNGSAMAVRSTKYNYAYSTQRCQLPEHVTNALGQSTTISYNYEFGEPSTVTDPNGLSVTWQHDDFGRATNEARPDNTYTTYSYKSCTNAPCWGFSDLRFLAIENDYDSTGNNYFTTDVFYDGRERVRFHESNRVFGTWTVNGARSYDSLGRLISESKPFSLSSNGSWSYAYDLLSRLTTAQLLNSSGGVDRTYSKSYAGRSSTVTDPLQNIKRYTTDVAGHLRRVTDPTPGNGATLGATTAYDFDDFGNLSQVTDAIGAVWQGFYNLRGFRYEVIDPDAGTWSFNGDSLNEPVNWTDPKSQQFSATYDPLGRLWTRTEPEGQSVWTWGNTPASHDIGSLDSVTGYGYTENLYYDSIGRLQTRKIITDATYQYDYAYNSLGTVDTVTYPTSPAPTGTTATRFTVKYGYSYGAPYLISDVTQGTPTTVWSLSSANDYSSPTNESLGGAVSVASAYTPWTDDLTGIQSGVGGSSNNRQNLAYQWDADGNLHQRQDLNQNLTEVFGYDALNRLTSSTLNGNSNLSAAYTNPSSGADQAGNIWSRSDVGSYLYGDSHHPHGVTSAGSYTFTYDNNGNVATRNGLSLTWASYNLPTSLQTTIAGTAYSSQFLYGPEHQRYQQTATYSNGTEVTNYVGGLLEKVTGTAMAGVTSYRHYVPTPSGLTVVLARNSDGTTTTTYALSDHLGSSDALVDGTPGHVGNLLVQESFAPFGQRRASNWSAGGPSSSDWTAIAKATRHGFTFHEMLDNVGLIHMNGRVYDPNVGRFLSTDPLIGDLGDTQSVNPYAYVGNRPLSRVDPSGWDGPPNSEDAPTSDVVITGSRNQDAASMPIAMADLANLSPGTDFKNLQDEIPKLSNGKSAETTAEILILCSSGCPGGEINGPPPDPSAVGMERMSKAHDLLVLEAVIPPSSEGGMTTVVIGVYLHDDGSVTVDGLSGPFTPAAPFFDPRTTVALNRMAAIGEFVGGVSTPIDIPIPLGGLSKVFPKAAQWLGVGGRAEAAVVGMHAGAAATGVPFKAIAGTRGLLHSFDRHAAQWFGREVGASTHLAEWQSVLERASRSSLQVSWSTGADATVGYLARIDGKYIFTQFYVGGPRAGELATAFVPDQAQLAQIFQLLGF